MSEWERTAFVVREAPGHWIHNTVTAIHAAGLRAVLLTPLLSAEEPAGHGGGIDGVCIVDDVRDTAAVVAAIRAFTGGVRPAGVVTAADGLVASAAQVAELLGVARGPTRAIAAAHNKFATREVLADAGLPGPRYAIIADPAEAGAVATQVGLPAIVKPVNGAASNLVRTVHSVDELAAAYRLLARRLPESPDARYHRPVPGGPKGADIDPARVFLVESMLRGPEYAVDVLIRDGIVEPVEIVGKPLIDERKFELGLCCPAGGLGPERAELIIDAVTSAVRALGLDNTVAHVEVIDDDSTGPSMVEVNVGRPAGAAVSALLKLRTGIDMFAELVSLSLGTAPPPRSDETLAVPLANLIIYPPGSGRLLKIHGLDEVAELPEVLDVVTTVSPGELLTDEQEVYAVSLIVAGFAADELAALHADATKLIRFELEELR